MKELVEYMAKALVAKTGEVEVRAGGADHSPVYELRVASSDIGRVIGRQGRTARSMRAILGAAAAKAHKRATLDIVE